MVNDVVMRILAGSVGLAAGVGLMWALPSGSSEAAVSHSRIKDKLVQVQNLLEEAPSAEGCGLQVDLPSLTDAVGRIVEDSKGDPSRRSYALARVTDLKLVVHAFLLNASSLCASRQALADTETRVQFRASQARASIDEVFSQIRGNETTLPWTSSRAFERWLSRRTAADWARFRRGSQTGLRFRDISVTPKTLWYLVESFSLSNEGVGFKIPYQGSVRTHCSWRWLLWWKWGYRTHVSYRDEFQGGVVTYSPAPLTGCRDAPRRRGKQRPLPALVRQLAYAVEEELERPCRQIITDAHTLGVLFHQHRPDQAGELYDAIATETRLRLLEEGADNICAMPRGTLLNDLAEAAVANAYDDRIGPRRETHARSVERAQVVVDGLTDALQEALEPVGIGDAS